MSVPARLTALLIAAGALLVTSGTGVAEETVTITVGDTWFCNESFLGNVCEVEVTAGDTVVWDFNGAVLPHTTTECGASCDDPSDSPLWDSDIIADGGTFQFTFVEAGTLLYRCNVHPSQMRGRIVVQAAPTATQPAPGDGEETAMPTAIQISGAPAAGAGPQEGTTGTWWALAVIAAAGATLAGLGAVAYARRRWT